MTQDKELVRSFNAACRYINKRRRDELRNNFFSNEDIDKLAPRPETLKPTGPIDLAHFDALVVKAFSEAYAIGSRKKRAVWEAVETVKGFCVTKDGMLCKCSSLTRDILSDNTMHKLRYTLETLDDGRDEWADITRAAVRKIHNAALDLKVPGYLQWGVTREVDDGTRHYHDYYYLLTPAQVAALKSKCDLSFCTIEETTETTRPLGTWERRGR